MGVIIGNNKASGRAPKIGAGSEELVRLAMWVVQELRVRKLFMVTVESCTGGGLANAITNITGASDVLKAGFIAYSSKQMIALGVPAKLIKKRCGVYSLEVAEAMAGTGLRSDPDAGVGVGITGTISRVDPTNKNSQPGVVYIAVKRGGKTVSKKVVFDDSGERWEAKEQIISAALGMILENLK